MPLHRHKEKALNVAPVRNRPSQDKPVLPPVSPRKPNNPFHEIFNRFVGKKVTIIAYSGEVITGKLLRFEHGSQKIAIETEDQVLIVCGYRSVAMSK